MDRRFFVHSCAALLLGASGVVGQALAANYDAIESIEDWSIFAQGTGTERVCWLASAPIGGGLSNPNAKRGEVYLMVSLRPSTGIKNEISYQAGYPLKQGSAALVVGESNFRLIADGEAAWTASPAEDDRVIAALEKGSKAQIKGESVRGTKSDDQFSLKGFSAALSKARSLCPVI